VATLRAVSQWIPEESRALRSSGFCIYTVIILPDPVAARSKALVCGRSLPGNMGSDPAGCMDSVVSVVCGQVEVSATGLSLVHRSPTECGALLCVI
jgi:hypothetical protein